MKNTEKIQSDPEALKARLNQPKTRLVEALKQFQATMPLAPRGMRELQQSESDSPNGRAKTTA
jgi:exonuclease VII small subunit